MAITNNQNDHYNQYNTQNNFQAAHSVKHRGIYDAQHDAQNTLSPKEKITKLALKVGVTTLAILSSPLILMAAGIIATSHLLCKPGHSLWDNIISSIILPAANRGKQTINHKIPPIPIEIESTNDSKLDGSVLLADGVPPEIAAHLPTVVIFNQNNGMDGGSIRRS